LYKTSPKNLRWVQVGRAGDWRNTVAWTSDRGALWSLESNGTLYKSNPQGEYEQLGGTGTYSDMSHLAALNNFLFTIEKGNLYRTK
jgi:hypothetical protein